jgi:hypothetical protein
VTDYSPRQLTFPSDKLPAISGLASKFHGIAEACNRGSRYLAGLWEKDLMMELSWRLDTKQESFHPIPREYRAPSWSWASVDGPISINRPLYSPLRPGGKFTRLAEMVDV